MYHSGLSGIIVEVIAPQSSRTSNPLVQFEPAAAGDEIAPHPIPATSTITRAHALHPRVTSSGAPKSANKGLSKAAIGGIVGGVLGGLLIAILAAFFIVSRRRKSLKLREQIVARGDSELETNTEDISSGRLGREYDHTDGR